MVFFMIIYFHLYVDASFEPDGYSGIGGILYDGGKVIPCFSEKVDGELIEETEQDGQKTVIQKLQMLALFVAVFLWLPILQRF